MGRKIQILIFMGILTGILFACSGEDGKSRQEQASDSGISGQAVASGNITRQAVTGGGAGQKAASGGAASTTVIDARAQKGKKYSFCNDSHLYYKSTDKKTLTERSLADGSEREIPIENFQALCYVDNAQVYFLRKRQKEGEKRFQSELWRAPVEDGRLDVERAELVFTEAFGIDSAYIQCDGRVLVYISGVFGEFQLSTYDLQTGMLDRIEANALFGVSGETVFYNEDAIMWQNLSSAFLDYKEISGEEGYAGISGKRDGSVAMTDTDFFYIAENMLWDDPDDDEVLTEIGQYHIADGSNKTIITQDQIRRSLIKEGFIEAGREEYYVYYPERLFVLGMKLYIQMDVSWSRDKVICRNKAVFSQKIGSGGKLCCERGLTECLANPGKDQKVFEKIYEEGYGDDALYLSRGGCLYMAEGKCFMYLYDPGKGKNRVACYNFASGKSRFLTEKDPDWYLPYNDGALPYWKAFVTEKEIRNDMPNNKAVDWPYWE